MKNKSLMSILLLAIIAFSFQIIDAQTYQKIADDTFGYVKAGTFGKPAVAKKTEKLSVGQVRVHYKTVTSRASTSGKNTADVTVYLDSDLTNGDLQNLTNEFYSILQQRLKAIGIESVDWKAIESTEYYAERQKSQADKKSLDADGKAGQAWVSFNAFDGPVLLRWKPYGGTEILGYSQMKKMAKTSEITGGDLVTFDVVIDFASIMLNTEVKQDKGFIFYGDPYFHADYSIGGLLSVPQSYIFMVDKKNGFDQYQSALPIAEGIAFSDKPYKDESKASLKTQTFFSGERHTFTPLVIPAKRDLYLMAARKVLTLYAEMFAEKMRILRSGEKPSDNKVAEKPIDKTTIKDVKDEAIKNNDTTPVTTGEITSAAKQAVKEGKFKLAADYYGELIKLNPNEFQHYFDRGVIYINNLKDYKAAVKDFGQAIKLNQNEPIIYYNRGSAYVQLSEFKKARKDFDLVLSAIPNYVDAYLNRGITLLNLKEYDAAINDFTRGIQLNPRIPNLYRARALVYKAKGNAAMAQADELRAAQIEQGR